MTSREEFNKLYWHSRRGMLELDLLLVPFMQEAYQSLPEADQLCYEKLLACEDTDMLQWFMQQSVPPSSDLQRIVNLILQRAQS